MIYQNYFLSTLVINGVASDMEFWYTFFMSIKRRKKHAYIAWVIISILAVLSMVGFLLAPALTNY